jgi:peptidoglycan-associated lipoprotein
MKLNFKPLALIIMLASTMALTGCGSTQKQGMDEDSSASMTAEEMSSEVELNADSDSGKAGALKSVYFGFNSATLTSDTRNRLARNAEFLKGNSSVEVQVEGHCDERGGVQYNLALGERRAKVVKNYLVSLGVSSSRISTISFGKERPISFGHDESAWGENRRGNFVVTAK